MKESAARNKRLDSISDNTDRLPGSIQLFGERVAEQFDEKWKACNRHYNRLGEMNKRIEDEWKYELATLAAIHLCGKTLPTAIHRCMNVLERWSAKALRFAVKELLLDNTTKVEKRLAVLEYRTRIHAEAIASHQKNKVQAEVDEVVKSME